MAWHPPGTEYLLEKNDLPGACVDPCEKTPPTLVAPWTVFADLPQPKETTRPRASAHTTATAGGKLAGDAPFRYRPMPQLLVPPAAKFLAVHRKGYG